jgi:hypothetical protein
MLAPRAEPWPIVIAVRHGETVEEAYARHIATHGPRPKLMQGGLLVVPALPETDDERIAAQERTAKRQAKLMAFVRQPRKPFEPVPAIEGMEQ